MFVSDRRPFGRSRQKIVVEFGVPPWSRGLEHPRPLHTVAVIPARFASTRFPGKALADIDGRPMIEHVYRRATESCLVSRVIVATDDLRIATAVSRFGGEVRLTRANHPSGTDRIAEVAPSIDGDVVVGVHGDEALIDPRAIDEAIAPFAADPGIQITTLYHRLT